MKDTKKIEQAASLEELFERLDRVIGGLEGEELSLEDSFNLYQEGMELVKCCNRTINDVEKKVLALDENGDGSSEPRKGSWSCAPAGRRLDCRD